MGTDIHIQVQYLTDDGEWRDLQEAPFGPETDDDVHPLDRSYDVFEYLGGRPGHEPPPGLTTGLPRGMTLHSRDNNRHFEDFTGGSQDLGDYGFLHGTVATWAALSWHHEDIGDLSDYGLPAWIRGQLTEIATRYGGPERVRILVGFDG